MTEHHLAIPRTARYHQLGTLSAQTRRVWFVCHGYGQLAAYFVRHFAFIADTDPTAVVIAPEGLSRFYLRGNGGRVGASWMTSDDRLHEINDHVGFLNRLANNILAACPPDVHITVLGFSQGTATVSRWLAQALFRPAQLILWAGGFPEDLEPAVAKQLLQGLALTVVVGTEDEYISAPQIEQLREHLLKQGAAPTLVSFVGKHELNQSVLKELASRFIR